VAAVWRINYYHLHPVAEATTGVGVGVYYVQSEGLGEDEESTAILNQLCSAHCSIAELYLTDLCYEENAENHCQAALDEAQKYDENRSPEVRPWFITCYHVMVYL